METTEIKTNVATQEVEKINANTENVAEIAEESTDELAENCEIETDAVEDTENETEKEHDAPAPGRR